MPPLLRTLSSLSISQHIHHPSIHPPISMSIRYQCPSIHHHPSINSVIYPCVHSVFHPSSVCPSLHHSSIHPFIQPSIPVSIHLSSMSIHLSFMYPLIHPTSPDFLLSYGCVEGQGWRVSAEAGCRERKKKKKQCIGGRSGSQHICFSVDFVLVLLRLFELMPFVIMLLLSPAGTLWRAHTGLPAAHSRHKDLISWRGGRA